MPPSGGHTATDEARRFETKTTELELLKNGAPYTWGRVRRIHEIGDIAIVEFLYTPADNEPKDHPPKIMFAPYYDNGKATNHLEQSLYQAILVAIEYSCLGCNERFAEYAARILGIEEGA